MGNLSKLIGSVVGGILTTLAALSFIPEEWASAENTTALVGAIGVLVTFGSSVFTYFFPKNKP